MTWESLRQQLHQAEGGGRDSKVRTEQKRLSELQDAYTDLVKKQQWVMEAGAPHQMTQARLTHEAAYVAGTHPIGGLGVAEMRPRAYY